MKVDVLLEAVTVAENGTTRKSCPGIVLIHWFPDGGVQPSNPASRTLVLQDNVTNGYADFREQFALRTEVTGRSWIEVQVVSMTDFGLLGKFAKEVLDLIKKKWPLPVGSSLLEHVSEDIKNGAPQVIAKGKSMVLAADSILGRITVELKAPADVFGDSAMPVDPVTGIPNGEQPVRPVLLKQDSPNGSVVINIEAA